MFFRERTKEILIIVVAALFVMAYAYSAFAADSMPLSGHSAKSFAGKVIAIDDAKKIATVRSAADEEKMFALNENGQVFRCGKAQKWDTIKVGDQVTVAYVEKAPGNYVAEFFALGMKRCS